MPPLSTSSTGRPPLYPSSPSSVRVDNTSDFEEKRKGPINPRSQQSISFSTKTEVYTVPNHEEYSRAEYERIWYSAKDLDTFTREAFEAARRIARRTSRRDDVTRGLESKSPQGFEETSVRRMRAILAVLSEQGRQYELGMNDDLRIAHFYFDCSEESVMQALDRAAIDALEATMYQQESPSERNTEDEDLFTCCFFSPLQWLKSSSPKPALDLL